MRKTIIPTCYFPSTLMLVDDSEEFLLNLTLHLKDNMLYHICSSPQEALDAFANAKQQSDDLHQRCFSEYLDSDGCPLTNQTINLHLAAIHWEAYNPDRFKEIAVVVVDFAMPGMNGLEFCEKLQNSCVKKILLTGKADEHTAIEAFNAGIIDRYVQKQNPDVINVINKNIEDLKLAYFQDMSDAIIKLLSVNAPSCLQDPVFATFFHELCERYHIVEYYLTEASGNFLLLDMDAKPRCLIVKSAHDLQLYYELARDNNASSEVLQQLRSGEKIPYFWQAENYYQIEWNEWATCLHPAQKLEGAQTYYYAVIEDPLAFDIQQNRITSYRNYLHQFDVTATQQSLSSLLKETRQQKKETTKEN